MNESRAAEVRTGLFVLLGAAVFVALSLWVAGIDPWGPARTRHLVSMPDAGGVRAGDPVRVAGVRVGRVLGVELRADPVAPVAFLVELDRGAPVSPESRAFFGSDGLLGSRFLALEPARSGADAIEDGDVLRGEKVTSLTEAMASFGDVVDRAMVLLEQTTTLVGSLNERVDPLLTRIEAMVSDDNARELRRALAALRSTLEETGPRLPAVLDRLEATLEGLDSGARGLPAMTEEARALVADLRRAVGPDGRRLAGLLDSADSVMDSASGTLGVVTGSAQDLEAALRDLRAAADHLEALTRDLGEHPHRLIMPSRRQDRLPGEGIKP